MKPRKIFLIRADHSLATKRDFFERLDHKASINQPKIDLYHSF